MANYASLPKWAQDEIKNLTSELARWKGQSADAPSSSNTRTLVYGTDARPVVTELGVGIQVVFRLDDGSDVKVRNHGHLIEATLNAAVPSASLGVLPRQSNSAHLISYSSEV